VRGQFLKIFLWFWGAMIALVLILVWTSAHLGGQEIPPMLEHAREVYQKDTTEVKNVLQSRGVAGLRNWLERHGSPRFMEVFLLTADGRSLLGRALPPRLRAFAYMPERYLEEAPPVRNHHVAVYPMVLPGTGYVRLLLVFHPPSPIWHILSYQRLAMALLVSGLVCWGLAAYLTAPVRELRRVTQGLASGDLNARAGKSLARRRDELGGLGRDFNTMASRLQSLIQSRQRLMADVSHELRSPLARLQIALGLARRRSGGEVSSELDRIEREADRLNELIGQILTLTRLDSQTALASEPIDMAAMVKTIVTDANYEAQTRNREVKLVGEVAAEIVGDESLLHSAIENIVRNAVRHTPEDSTVEVDMEIGKGGQLLIEIRDKGPGIDESLLDKVFEPFFRVDEARNREAGGHGLGMSIAQRAVTLHRGTISASNTGEGLLVRIYLPLTTDGVPELEMAGDSVKA